MFCDATRLRAPSMGDIVLIWLMELTGFPSRMRRASPETYFLLNGWKRTVTVIHLICNLISLSGSACRACPTQVSPPPCSGSLSTYFQRVCPLQYHQTLLSTLRFISTLESLWKTPELFTGVFHFPNAKRFCAFRPCHTQTSSLLPSPPPRAKQGNCGTRAGRPVGVSVALGGGKPPGESRWS